ncbi:hypothetical protein TL16_g10756 [Triparma laevis f. inornata]|nr:hypothetical protein TrLO_g14694 [Triparma laevis f. longispina]GMH87117.1 hypothetical protein TL16_g10756 [Triparma laevis f. inornata]
MFSKTEPIGVDPILGLQRHAQNVKKSKKRKKLKNKLRGEMVNGEEMYGAPSPPQILVKMPSVMIPQDKISVLPYTTAISSLKSKLDRERFQLEQSIASHANSILAEKSRNGKMLEYYNLLNKGAMEGLPLHYIFRKAVEKYVRVKTGCAIVLWKKFIKIDKARESVQAFEVLQAEVIQRFCRCCLAKFFVRIQRRKYEEYKIECVKKIQNRYRRKLAGDVFSAKKSVIIEAKRNYGAKRIQKTWKCYKHGTIPARVLIKKDLHKALKCLTGRMGIHRAELMSGLFPRESRLMKRGLEIVTASGIPFYSLGGVKEVKGIIEVVWKVIRRREEEGARLKREWKGKKDRKERERREQLEAKLREAKEKHAKIMEESEAMEEFENMGREEAEQARRIQRRLEREIQDMAQLEEHGWKNEREAMAREERFQKQDVGRVEKDREEDVKLEISNMQAEERFMRDLNYDLREIEEREEMLKREEEHRKWLKEDKGAPRKRDKVRFHRRGKRHFVGRDGFKNRRDYLKKMAEEQDKNSSKQKKAIPKPTSNPTRRRKAANFAKNVHPAPFTISKIDGRYVRLFCEPVPSEKAVAAMEFVEKISETKIKYEEALKGVAKERGELVRLQDILDDKEDFLMRLKAKTRLERKHARDEVLEAADEVQEQQLAVDDAETELMASAKGTVVLLKEAAKILKVGELPKFKFDVNQRTPNTKSSTSMNAAREWLRQLSNWCMRAETKIKVDVGERFINSLRVMGIIEVDHFERARKAATTPMVKHGNGTFLFDEEHANFDKIGLQMLERAGIKELMVTLCCECDYRIFGYCEGDSTLFVEKLAEEEENSLLFGEDVMETYNVLNLNYDLKVVAEEEEDQTAVVTCLSHVVREAMMKGREGVANLRETLISVKSHEDLLAYQANRNHHLPNAAESKRIRAYLRRLVHGGKCSLALEEEEVEGEDGEKKTTKVIKIKTVKAQLAIEDLVTTRKEELKEIRLKSVMAGGVGGRGLFGLLDQEAEEVRSDEEEGGSVTSSVARREAKIRIHHQPICFYEAMQVKFELELHNRKLVERLEDRGRNGSVGGGIYLYPAISPNKDVIKHMRHEKMMEDEKLRLANVERVKKDEEEKKREDEFAVSEQQRLFNEWARQQEGEEGGGVGLDQALLMKKMQKDVEEKKEEGEGVEVVKEVLNDVLKKVDGGEKREGEKKREDNRRSFTGDLLTETAGEEDKKEVVEPNRRPFTGDLLMEAAGEEDKKEAVEPNRRSFTGNLLMGTADAEDKIKEESKEEKKEEVAEVEQGQKKPYSGALLIEAANDDENKVEEEKEAKEEHTETNEE